MLIYIIVMAVCTLLMFCYQKIQYIDYGDRIKPTYFNDPNFVKKICRCAILIIVFLIMTIVMGCRDITIGTDNVSYKRFFDTLVSGGTFGSYNDSILFYSFMKLVTKFTDNYAIWSLAIAAVMHLFVVGFVKRAKSPWMTMFLFFIFDHYFMETNMLRQSLAMSIILYVVLLPNKSIRTYFFKAGLVIASCLIHKVFFIFVPVLFIASQYKGDYKKLLILFAVIFLVLIISEPVVLVAIDIFLPGYVDSNYETNFFLEAMFYSGIYALIILWVEEKNIDNIKNDKVFRVVSIIVMMQLCLYAIAYVASLNRLILLFSTFKILLYPYLFSSIKDEKSRIACQIIFVAIMSIDFIFSGHAGEAIPYLMDDFWLNLF